MSSPRRRPRASVPRRGTLAAGLIALVVVPSTCVLWLAQRAADNERLAGRQRLIDAYRVQLVALRSSIEAGWGARMAKLDGPREDIGAPRLFADKVREGWADAVIVLGGSGEVLYPTSPPPVPPAPLGEAWLRALRLEHRDDRPAAAAAVYSQLARRATGTDEAARALLAQSRCLARAGRTAEAREILGTALAADRYRAARDPQGRLIAAQAALRALELIGGADEPEGRDLAARLAARLTDYGDPPMPAWQRRFLMRAWSTAGLGEATFETLEAEQLAADVLAAGFYRTAPTVLRGSNLDGVWQVLSPDRRVMALFREDRVVPALAALLGDRPEPGDVALGVLAPDGVAGEDVLLTHALGASLPGWRLALSARRPSLLTGATGRRVAVDLWAGVVAVATTVLLAVWIARSLRRQLRATALENDLLATVTHELKTPVASMRALIESLLGADRHPDPQRTREYLDLMASENARLGRLIDNFLTFSRWGRGHEPLDLETLDPGRLAERAARGLAEAFELRGRGIELEIAPDLPAIRADADAMVTVLTNLLDNADKFSPAGTPISLRVFADRGSVGFAVADRGIGLDQRHRTRIFRRFYQVDRRLSRRGGGCGLGLAIVRTIVRRHGGTIEVESRPGVGSTFTVRLAGREEVLDGRVAAGDRLVPGQR